jgi:NADPH-dependent FMN reductase
MVRQLLISGPIYCWPRHGVPGLRRLVSYILEEISVRPLDDIPFYNEDVDVQPELPPVADFRSNIAESNGIVIATPKYNHGVPGCSERTRLGVTTRICVLF